MPISPCRSMLYFVLFSIFLVNCMAFGALDPHFLKFFRMLLTSSNPLNLVFSNPQGRPFPDFNVARSFYFHSTSLVLSQCCYADVPLHCCTICCCAAVLSCCCAATSLSILQLSNHPFSCCCGSALLLCSCT